MLRKDLPREFLRDLESRKEDVTLPIYYDGRFFLVKKDKSGLTVTPGTIKASYDSYKTTETAYRLAEHCRDLAAAGHAYPIKDLMNELSFTTWEGKGRAISALQSSSLLERKGVLKELTEQLSKLVTENEDVALFLQLEDIKRKLKGLKGRKTALTKELVDQWVAMYSSVSKDAIIKLADTLEVKIEKDLREEFPLEQLNEMLPTDPSPPIGCQDSNPEMYEDKRKESELSYVLDFLKGLKVAVNNNIITKISNDFNLPREKALELAKSHGLKIDSKIDPTVNESANLEDYTLEETFKIEEVGGRTVVTQQIPGYTDKLVAIKTASGQLESAEVVPGSSASSTASAKRKEAQTRDKEEEKATKQAVASATQTSAIKEALNNKKFITSKDLIRLSKTLGVSRGDLLKEAASADVFVEETVKSSRREGLTKETKTKWRII